MVTMERHIMIIIASMRPRQACLGIQTTDHAHVVRAMGFNEAEASLPRNRRTVGTDRRHVRCFNEAEASLPRNPEKEYEGYENAMYLLQ